MGKLKKLIIILIVILIIAIAIIWGVAHFKESPYGNVKTDNVEPLENTIQKVDVRNNYFAVKNCINKFYTYYNMIYDENYDETARKEYIEMVYSMLDKEYITYKNITTENFTTIFPAINKVTVEVSDMYVMEKELNLNIYFVYGHLIDEKTKEVKDFSMIVKIDMINRTFKILMQDYMEKKYNDIKIGDNIDINYEGEIAEEIGNTFSYKIIDNETYLIDVLKSFKNNMLYNTKEAYEKLNEEYRTKRFPTLEDFEKYVKNNLVDVTLMRLKKFQKNSYEDYIQYVCIDSRGNYYIINEKETLNYNIILDTYTIDVPQFIEQYEDAIDIEKVGLNIGKIEQAVNEGDFKYIYNKLDENFKRNNFNELSKFENYFKTIVFEKNNFEYENIEEKANVYTATITISNAKDYSASTRKLNIVMQLKEGTDFVMSFRASN